MALVFQYGSNTSSKRFNADDRLRGDARPVGLVRTQSAFELEFSVWSNRNKCAAANIRPDKGRVIWGVLYEIPDFLLARETAGGRTSLDEIEGRLYERRPVSVQEADGTSVGDHVLTYTVREPRPGLETSLAYVSNILAGLREHKAPDDYLAYVKDRITANNQALAIDVESL